MRRIVAMFVLQSVTLLAGIAAIFPNGIFFTGFVAGLVIFGVSALLLCALAWRLVRGGGAPTPGGIGWFVLGFGVKFAVLGTGCYVAFSLYALSVAGVISGALASLVMVVLSLVVPEALASRKAAGTER